MAAKKYSAEEIVEKLRQVDLMISRGWSVGGALDSVGVSQATYYRWRSKYGGLTRTLRLSVAPAPTKTKIQS
jgi:putative transposase